MVVCYLSKALSMKRELILAECLNTKAFLDKHLKPDRLFEEVAILL